MNAHFLFESDTLVIQESVCARACVYPCVCVCLWMLNFSHRAITRIIPYPLPANKINSYSLPQSFNPAFLLLQHHCRLDNLHIYNTGNPNSRRSTKDTLTLKKTISYPVFV